MTAYRALESRFRPLGAVEEAIAFERHLRKRYLG